MGINGANTGFPPGGGSGIVWEDDNLNGKERQSNIWPDFLENCGASQILLSDTD